MGAAAVRHRCRRVRLLVPVLAGFIAFAIADRPGLAPGFVGGAIAAALGTGFLGGIAAGLLGGFTAWWVTRWAVPPGLRHVLPVVVTPLRLDALTGAALIVVLGRPLRAVTTGLAAWLDGLSGVNLVVLGVVLGLMMGFDLGGPVNKVAYAFATAGLAAASTSVAAARPARPRHEPEGHGGGHGRGHDATARHGPGQRRPRPALLRARARERQCRLAARRLLHLRGRHPLRGGRPLRVIASSMAGSAVAGALVMAFGSDLRAPHGGIWVLPLIGSPQLFLLALAAGASSRPASSSP